MGSNGQDQLLTAGEHAAVGQHSLSSSNPVYGLPGGGSMGEAPAASSGSRGTALGGSSSLFGMGTTTGDAELHTPTPTRELPNPLATVAPPSSYSGIQFGYPSAHGGAQGSGTDTAYQAQTVLPSAPSMLQHRSNPSLASIASTGSTTSSSMHNWSQPASPASASSSPSAVAGSGNGQAGVALSSVPTGQTSNAVPNTVFTFSQPTPLHISTGMAAPSLQQSRTPSSASNGSSNASSGSGQSMQFANQQGMQGIAIAGSSSVSSSNPTTPMPQSQPAYPLLGNPAQALRTEGQQAQQQAPQQPELAAPIALGTTRWESGAELALRAAEELASSYNKIAEILSKGLAIEMTERLEIRQEFVAAVAALDKAFFLSPAGPGYIGTEAKMLGSRKRGYTVSSTEETDDSNKHRRTTSDAVSEIASSSGRLVSPRSAGSSIASRPRLFHHTHSSPLLPVESHYRPTSTGVSDLQPVNKAADLATSGSHLVGRLSASHAPTNLSISSLAEEEMQTDEQQIQQFTKDSHSAQEAILESQQKQQQQQMQPTGSNIIAPVPQSLGVSAHLDLAASLQQAVLQQEQQTGLQFLQQPPPLDPQAYAQQVLRNQDLLLAQAGSSLEPAFEPLTPQIPMSQSSTPTPYQPYITPPMSSIPQFQPSHSVMDSMQYDLQPVGDLNMLDVNPALTQSQPDMHQSSNYATATANQNQASGVVQSFGQSQPNAKAENRPLHPGSLDFTTLRGPGSTAPPLATGPIKEEQLDGMLTSPYASSSFSNMSSFPFTSTFGTNTATSVTSDSRSRATSLSKSTSAARSRAPSYSSVSGNPYNYGAPDAHELEHILGSMTTLPSPINEDDDDYFDSFYENQSGTAGSKEKACASNRGSSPGATDAAMQVKEKDKEALAPELSAKFQEIFSQWLPFICSDVEIMDKRGERIHQPLMAKRMAKLDEEHAFRPFKFRIQPFTLAFQDACKDAGMSEADSAIKHVKHFLWNQPLISRFNDEGKKSKSRGNHVWSIEARFIAAGVYEFRPPPPKIVPIPPPAAPGLHWTWQPKVLDSQCQGPPMDADFVCSNLPAWLDWEDGILSGHPPDDACSLSLEIIAEYAGGNKLTQIFSIPVVAENGIRQLSNDAILAPSETPAPNMLTFTARAAPALHESTTSSSGSDLTASTISVRTPPAYAVPPAPAPTPALMPSPMTGGVGGYGQEGHSSRYSGLAQLKTQAQQSAHVQLPGHPPSPQHVGPYPGSLPAYLQNGSEGQPQPAPVPFCIPTHPTDATTLASASHIKAKLVEVTTNHHGNLSVLDPAHPPADPYKVSVAVDAAISHQLAVTAAHPQMPSATEVFNATLEVSTRSQQMQQEQLTQVVAAVTQQMQQQQIYQAPSSQQQQMSIPPQHPAPHQQQQQQQQRIIASGLPLSAQVTSQLADFSFTPCNTPGTRSPETHYQARMPDYHHE